MVSLKQVGGVEGWVVEWAFYRRNVRISLSLA